MKLSALFAKYLYQHKELKLPGIGIFSIDPSIPVPDLSDKNFPDYIHNIRYVQKPIAAADEDFINFIRTETGKIKPLAESDLDSYLSDGKILLNIGKPFQLEGIGFLQKNKEGLYEFAPGEPVLQRLENYPHESSDDSAKHKSFFGDESSQNNYLRKLLLAAGVIAVLALVIWLGYRLYNRNTSPSPASDTDNSSVAPSDSSNANIILDSVKRIINSSKPEDSNEKIPGTYKFVIERTANKNRAYRRFNQLKDNQSKIKMESRDSTLFSLYFILPAHPSDTARIKDSLRIWYGRKQVYVE